MVTYDAIVRYARTLEGESLETSAQHKGFEVEVDKNGLAYVLESGKRRVDNKPTIENVLTRFNETKSYKPGDYQDLTVNASYLTRVIELMTSGGNT